MTLVKLRKTVEHYRELVGSNTNAETQYQQLKGLSFYNWQDPKDTNTFNHIIGLPKKDVVRFPLFDYERLLFNTLQQHKHVWVKKATGLGITEFMLRYIAWLCVRDDSLRGAQICFVTGPRIELAIELIKRTKRLFEERLQILFDTKETVLELNGVHIEAFPSHHLDAMRSLTNPKFILLDEADFFPPGQQQDARDVSERYIAKSNPWIVMISTPNAPGGLFEKIEREPESTCMYKRIYLDYTYGLDRIYDRGEIEKAKASPSFEREYNLKYLGKVGNVFHTLDIEAAICSRQEGEEMMNWSRSEMIGRSMGIDVAWGDTSKFAIVITQYRNNKVEAFLAESFEHPQMTKIIDHVMQLKQTHHCTKVYVDGANPEVIRELKRRIGEYQEYHDFTEEEIWAFRNGSWQIIPVNFQKRHREMLQWAYTLMAKRYVKIYPSLRDLIVSLRTAVVLDDWKLDKYQTSNDDLLDGFRLALLNYEIPSS